MTQPSVHTGNTPGTTVGPDFDAATWDMVGSLRLAKQLVSGTVIADLADHRDDVCVLTADLGGPTGVQPFRDRHPARYYNFGIAERGMLSAAAGMAAAGMRPYVSGYAAFLALIGTEQIRTDLCYPNMPVRVLATHAGVAMGFYGTSHHSTEDIGVLRSVPNLTMLAPVDGVSLEQALRATVDHPGPIYFRLGRGRETPVYDAPADQWAIGGSHRLREGDDATIIATGICVAEALEASARLADEGLSVRVVNAYSLKPIDAQAIHAAAAETRLLVTAEEHNVVGGLGSAVADVLSTMAGAPALHRIGLPDEYSLLGPPTHLYRHYGIDADGIASTVRDELAHTR